ncbi:MAG: hypothetical protein ACFB21_12370 [Opitutales bacterium]
MQNPNSPYSQPETQAPAYGPNPGQLPPGGYVNPQAQKRGFPWTAVLVTSIVTSGVWIIVLIAVLAMDIGQRVTEQFGNWLEEPFVVDVDYPNTVERGNVLELTSTVAPVGSEAEIINSIDLWDTFIDGFEVVSTEPPFIEQVGHYGDFESFFFDPITAEPGTTETVTFRLRPTAAGTFAGDADVCNPVESFTEVPLEITVTK